MKAALIVAFGLAAAASPALATANFSDNITSTLVVGATGATAAFGNTPDGTGETLVDGKFDFTDTYTFNYDFSGTASGSVINIRLGSGQDIDFTSIMLNGVLGSFSNVGGLSTAFFEGMHFTSGLQSIVVSGRSTGTASYGGNVQITNAVPEPASWALMLIGFGLVGTSLRRRNVAAVTA